MGLNNSGSGDWISAIASSAQTCSKLVSARAAEINSCLAKIPRKASVAATSSLIPHLTHRNEIYAIHENKQAEYVAIDLSTSIWPLSRSDVNDRINELDAQGYKLICVNNLTFVYKK
jgi:hypothetical protein